MSDLESGDVTRRDMSGAYLSKMKILKLLGDLERFMLQNERWSPLVQTDRRSPTDHRPQVDARRLSSRWPSSRAREDFLTHSLTSSLLSNLAGSLSGNETAANGKRLFSSAKNKKSSWGNKPSEGDEYAGDDESEYFSDAADYLPSESVLKFALNPDPFNNQMPETDFIPITDPASLFIRPDQRDDKSNQLKPNVKWAAFGKNLMLEEP